MTSSVVTDIAAGSAAREDLARMAESAGDLLYLSGMQMAEVGATGPTLEGALSAVALAQTHLGHARQCYRLAHLLRGESGTGGDHLPPAEERCEVQFVRSVPDTWIDLVTIVFAANLAVTTVLREFLRHAPLAAQVRKMLDEQEHSLNYSSGWVEGLLRAEPPLVRYVRGVLEAVASEAEQWLRTLPGEAAVREGLVAGGQQLAQAFRSLCHEYLGSDPPHEA